MPGAVTVTRKATCKKKRKRVPCFKPVGGKRANGVARTVAITGLQQHWREAMSWERYIRRLGAWRAFVYIAIAVAALAWVLVAHAATVGQ